MCVYSILPIICADDGEKMDGRITSEVNSNFGYDHEIMVIIEYRNLDMHTEYLMCSIILKTTRLPEMHFTHNLSFIFLRLRSKHYSYSEMLVGLHVKWLLKVSSQNENEVA
jgi:hypothetical protein